MNSETASTYDAFNRDVEGNTGYLYTTNARLSSRMANRRLSDVTMQLADWRDRRVIDVGCGDGTYSIELFERGKPGSLVGVDPAAEAIEVARRKAGNRAVSFEAYGAYELPYENDSFDIVHLRGVLHHLDRPIAAMREAFRIAPRIVVIDPNGYNPGVKLLEKRSAYHVAHQEKSYAPATLDRWVEGLSGQVESRAWVGLVPFFCPDWMACSLKFAEPILERTPVLNQIGCAVYAFSAVRKDRAGGT